VEALARHVTVLQAPLCENRIDLTWLMSRLGDGGGGAPLTSLLVEGGGEVHASFLQARLAHRWVSFLAPKVLGGNDARRSVGGDGFQSMDACPRLVDTESRRLAPDLMLAGNIVYPPQT
jgi:diaminohydroxyphosphoribosylaminopyrimidine deaminase/5-amino-6-(5-phosphoribosylamino)uracil reductase